jgi:hypothetical protein
MTLTRSHIVGQIRKRKDAASEDSLSEHADSFSFLELWNQEWKDNLFSIAIERTREKTSARAFQIYSYCVLQDHGPRETASTLKISLASVHLTTHRFGKLLKKEIKMLMEESNQE